MMKRIRLLSALLMIIIIGLPGIVSAQLQDKAWVNITDSENEQEKPIILDPVVHPALYYDGSEVEFGLENGIFIVSSQIGIESTLIQSNSSIYGNFFAGIIHSSEQGLFSRGGAWVSGLSVGQQINFRNRSNYQDENKVEFYFRAGPGIGLGGSGTMFGSDAVYYFGLNGNAIIGAQLRLSERNLFYMHGGGRLLWFPEMKEVGFLGFPMISVGFRFDTSSGIDPVRY